MPLPLQTSDYQFSSEPQFSHRPHEEVGTPQAFL